MTGHCSKCHKVWTLDTPGGQCQWCGESSNCESPQASSRVIKSRSRHTPEPTIADYSGLEGRWVTYYKVATAYESKIPLADRDDWRHDCMLELERAEKRDRTPLPDLRAYRIASLTVALYYRQIHRFLTRVCVYNGYPQTVHCKECTHKSEGKRCVWLAVRPVEILEDEVVDDEGYRVALMDTVASDKVEDMPERWTELNEVKRGLPLRLVEIAYKKLDGKPLDKKDQKFLERYRKQAQKRLF